MAKFSDKFPIASISSKGTIIGDFNANLTKCFRLKLPVIFNLGEDEFEELIEKFRSFLELLGGNTLVHKQDFFFRDYYSLNPNDFKSEASAEFINRSYQRHFNERAYQYCESYLYITKINTGAAAKSLVSKEFAKTDEDVFLSNILSSAEILKPYMELSALDAQDLEELDSPIYKFCNFSNARIDEFKDIDFSGNKIYVGSKEIKIYTIQDLHQFPVSNVSYCKEVNGLPVSNMFYFGYPLDVPHINNHYIFIPDQDEFKMMLDSRYKSHNSYNVKNANSDSLSDILTFKQKMNDLALMGVYYHFNTFCFDDNPDVIDKKINVAFAESGFKKKENSINRKDLFWSAFPSNGSVLVQEKDRLMCMLTDLEAATFSSFEKNNDDGISGVKGVRLCDRIYGIPFEVDIFDQPKKKGIINNQNTICVAGSGGGKSFSTNLIFLEQYRQGDHIFIIDASFSYKLQCAMHGGVYLTFDAENKITFNPFYLNWLKDPRSKEIFNLHRDMSNSFVSMHSDYLEDKISVISGLITTMTKNENEDSSRFEETVYRKLIFNYFRDRCLNNKVDQMKFDDFYEFIKSDLPKALEENGIEKEDFNGRKFLMMLEPFTSGQSLGYLLNSMDEKIKNLDAQRFIVIDVSKIRDNKILFSVVSILAMDLYNQKVAKLPIGVKKIFCVDEAWQSISSPEMATFMKAQVKVIRKYGGLTFFISQELDDFISSEIIRDSIINNSAIKIFADMGEFKNKFEPIKKALAISDNNEKKIKSLNQNRRAGAFYKEICICWGQYAQVYAVETPLELKAIFETDPDEVQKILPQYKEYGVELTAINYANH